MHTCPLCEGQYADPSFNYCPIDGAPLSITAAAGAQASGPLGSGSSAEEILQPSKYSLIEDVVLPFMGERISDAKIVKWYKQAGETLQDGEPLYELSTDKADAEMPSPCSGVLLEIVVPAGKTVPVKTVIARIRRPIFIEGDEAV